MFPAPKDRRSSTVAAAAIIGLAAVFYLAFVWRSSFVIDGVRTFTLFDDAMISMRYASNLAAGQGLVWNPGEAPVEGYSNPLWMLWMALIHLFPLPEAKVALAVQLSGVLILILNAVVAARIAARLSGDDALAVLSATALVGLHYASAFWTLRGMEVGLLTLLIDVALLVALDPARRFDPGRLALLAAVLGLALLVRMDALVGVVVVWGYVLIAVPRDRLRRCLSVAIGSSVAVLGGQLAVRLAVFGELLPNTYYLKVSGVSAAARFARGLDALGASFERRLWAGALLALISLAVLAVRGRGWRASPALCLLPAVFLAQAAYSVYVGGDAWEWTGYSNRYLCVGIPALLVFVSVVAARASRVLGPRARPRAVAAILLLAVGLEMNLSPIVDWVERNAVHVQDDAEQVRIALRLRSSLPQGCSLAVVRAGAVPYFVQRRCVDLLGKTDPVIARTDPVPGEPFYPGHNKWDYGYSIGELRPDFVLELWQPTERDRAYLEECGYRALENGSYARPGLGGVEEDRDRSKPSGLPDRPS